MIASAVAEMANVSGINADQQCPREARCARHRELAQVMVNKTDLPWRDEQLLHDLPSG